MKLRIGLVFGEFDKVSVNDLEQLEKARSCCDRLVIALQSDNALGQAGFEPMQDQRSRAYVLASLAFSDAVVVCDEQTVEKLLATLLPDVVIVVQNTGLGTNWPEGWSGNLIDLTGEDGAIANKPTEGKQRLSRYATN
jgi:bifunctional ADP-heptose synthase (sugar kinase/adenylyltransferase)